MAGQPTPGQARVVDPVLSAVARAYENADMVGKHLFPTVPVMARGGKLIEFDKTDFKKINTERAPGSNMKRIQFGHEGKDYAIVDHGIEGQVPIENLQDAAQVPGIDLASRSVKGAQDTIALEKELKQAKLATTQANYDNANVVSLAGNNRWDNENSDPANDVAAGVARIRSQIGRRPNVAIVGAEVYDKALKHHPKILDRIKHTSRDTVTADLLASLWDVKSVFIGDSISFDDAGETATDVWGENVVLAYTEQGSVDMGRPSFGFTYQLNGSPSVEMTYFDERSRSYIYPVVDCYKPAIVGKDAGYLIRDILT